MNNSSKNTKIISLKLIAVFAVTFMSVNLAFAQFTGPQVNVSAYLVNEKNQPIANGEYDVRFALYLKDRTIADIYPSDSDTNSRAWFENQKVFIRDGVLSAYLGSTVSLPTNLNFKNNQYYLGIRINTDSEMIPRKKISASPFSIDALSLDGATLGTGKGNIAKLGNGGKFNIKMIPTGKGSNQLVLGNDARFDDIHLQNTDKGTSELTFNVGSDTSLDGNIFDIAVSSAINKPALRFDGNIGKWQYSNDGTTFSMLGQGSVDASQISSGILAPQFGGTGNGTYAIGDMLFANTTNTLEKLLAGSNDQVLAINAGVPAWTSFGNYLLASHMPGAVSSPSGLEMAGGKIAMLQGCNNGQVLKWDSATNGGQWICSTNFADTQSVINVNGTANITELDFNTQAFNAISDFTFNNAAGVGTIGIDYVNSKITRANQAVTVSGNWLFNSGTWNGFAIADLYISSAAIWNAKQDALGFTAYNSTNPAGYISANESITLSGDITGSGSTAINTTIGPGRVALNNMSNLAALSIIGNNTAASATPSALSNVQVKTLLAIAQADVSGLTMASSPLFSGLTVDGSLNIKAGTFSTILQASGLQANNINYILPSAAGSGGQVLKTDNSGNLYWATVSGGSGGIGTVTNVGSANGLTGGPITESGALSVALLSANGGTASNSSFSGLQFSGVSNNQLSLLQGCTNNEVLSWDNTAKIWQCASVSTVGGLTGGGINGQVAIWNGANTLSGQNQLNPAQGGTGIDGSIANIGAMLIGNGSGYTLSNISGEANVASSGIVTLSNNAIIGKILTGYVSGAGVISDTDTILQAIEKLNGNDHNALTISTGNGLSLASQVLSLAQANSSTTGALSFSDWNNFNDANTRKVLSWNAPLSFTAGTASLNYDVNNLKITTNALNTIQDITLTSAPTFAGLNITNGVSSMQLTNNGVNSNIASTTGNLELGTAGNLELSNGVNIIGDGDFTIMGDATSRTIKIGDTVKTNKDIVMIDASNLSLAASGMLDASVDGLATKISLGAVTDASFTGAATNGLMAIDSSNGRIYFRYNAAWHYVNQTGGFQIPNYEVAPKNQLDAVALIDADNALPFEQTHYADYLSSKMQVGELLMPYVDSFLPDGAAHGLYARFEDVKKQMFGTEQLQISGLALKTDENAVTLASLKKSIDEQLAFASVQLTNIDTKLSTDDAKIIDNENRIKNIESISASLQTQIDLLKLNSSTELASAKIDLNTQNIELIKMTLGINNTTPNDIQILGKLKAQIAEAGKLVVSVVDSGARNIGEGVILKITQDANGDGIDDITKSDGKTFFVKTRAVSNKSKIFVTSKIAADQALAVINITDGEGFTVAVKNKVAEDIKFDWMIIEENNLERI